MCHCSATPSSVRGQKVCDGNKRNVKGAKTETVHCVCECIAPGAAILDKGRKHDGHKYGEKVCLDGHRAKPVKITHQPDRLIYKPPVIDNRPRLDSMMSCYAATVLIKKALPDGSCGCSVADGPHSHHLTPRIHLESDYCTDPCFEAPKPPVHETWSADPSGACHYPQYCRADCFDHYPQRNWNKL